MINRSRFPNFISRSEIKLKLRTEAAERLRREVERHLPLYCYAPGRAITFVSSVYFDTMDFFFYNRAKWFPHDNLKVRVKEYYYQLPGGYEYSPSCWIEIKRRLNKSTLKSRFQIAKDLVAPLFAGENLLEDIVRANGTLSREYIGQIYGEFLEIVRGREMRPQSVTNYRRRTYQEPGDESVRITFDDMIAYFRAPPALYNGTKALTRELLGAAAGQQKHTVVEIKVARSKPEWLAEMLGRYPQSNFSKFLTSTQALLALPGVGLRAVPEGDGRWKEPAPDPEAEKKRASGPEWMRLDRFGTSSFEKRDGRKPTSPEPTPRTS